MESRKTVLMEVNLTDSSRLACPSTPMLQFRPATVISWYHAAGGLTTVVHRSTCTPLVVTRIIVSFYVQFAVLTHTNTCVCLHIFSIRACMVYAIDLLYVYMFVVLLCFRHVQIIGLVMQCARTNMWESCLNGSEQLWFIYL